MNFTHKVRSWTVTLSVELDEEKQWWGRKSSKPRVVGSPLLPAKGKIPNRNSNERMLQGYYLMKKKGLPVDALELLIKQIR